MWQQNANIETITGQPAGMKNLPLPEIKVTYKSLVDNTVELYSKIWMNEMKIFIARFRKPTSVEFNLPRLTGTNKKLITRREYLNVTTSYLFTYSRLSIDQ